MPDGQTDFTATDRGAPAGGPRPKPELTVRTARNIEDIMKVTVVRAAVYMTEQNCPYDEEFDGNDFCATHLLGFVNGDPAACLRIRYFGGFAKLERVAVRQCYRNTQISFKIIREAITLCNRKGFTKIIGHARDELIPLWKMFGFEVLETSRHLVFSDYSYTEMVNERPLQSNAITLETCPYQLIRPEGDWDQPGILEHSVERDANKGTKGFAIAAE